ncbi:MAG: filamentous hemagglutinin N-terminal domain-containing protein [Methylococcaceae bacterium]|nr:filamentous hemagglutinin N-terminal domain-containing protein [Methylococcaceae bacterium]
MATKQKLTQHPTHNTSFRLNPLSACVKAVIASGVFMGGVAPVQAELPIASPVWIGSGSATSNVVGNTLNINQNTDRAILNWDKFNVSADSAVNFKQPSTSSIALNRIADSNPSQILGSVSANGQIYLVNQNGFVFGKDSVVNARGVVASTLDVDTQIFKEGGSISKVVEDTRIQNLDDRAAFKGNGEFYQKNADGSFKLDAAGKKIPITIEIKSGAQIKSTEGGRILVLAPTILNSGNVESSGGQVIMAAATDKVYLQEAGPNSDVRGLLVEVKTGGKVENLGAIAADRGNVTLMGFAVNQKGKVSATTSTNLNGTIRLLAREGGEVKPLSEGGGLRSLSTTRTTAKDDELGVSATVTLDTGSRTEILPEVEYIKEETVLESGEKVTRLIEKTVSGLQKQPQSRVEILANTVHMKSGSEIVAPSGKVTATATANPRNPVGDNSNKNSSRILIDAGATIDVAGLDTQQSMESNVVEVELRNFELQDAPLQKNGILKGKTVLVDKRVGTPLSNIQSAIDGVGLTVSERHAKGGEINLQSEGDVIVEQGSTLDFSGGSTQFQDGFITTSKLVSNKRLVDISEADPLLTYDAIYGEVIKKYEKWGVTKTWSIEGPFALGRFEKGYVQGHDAGSVAVRGHNVILDGDLLGHAIAGRRQRNLVERAAGGSLTVDNGFSTTNPKFQSLVFANTQNNLNLDIDDLLPTDGNGFPDALTIRADKLLGGGIQTASFNTNGEVVIADNATLKLVDGGKLSLKGGAIDVLGDIEGKGATVNLETALSNSLTLDGDINVAEGSNIRLQGEWVNDFVSPTNLDSKPLAINGGKFIAKAGGNAGGEINLKAGSLIDVSGGAWLQTSRDLVAGSAGEISLIAKPDESINSGSNVIMDGVLNAYGLEKGGKITVEANAVAIRREELQAGSEPLQPLQLTSDFFSKGGFAEFDITSNMNGLTVENGVNLNLQQKNRVLNDDFMIQANASDLGAFAHIATLLPEQRSASKLTLRANHSAGINADSDLDFAAGATINADDLSSVALISDSSLFFDGVINAHGGNVLLNIVPSQSNPDSKFQETQGIWLGSTAKIDVSGSSRILVDNLGHRKGDVFNGGNVTVDAQRGFFATQSGSLLNVSGTQAILDLPQNSASSVGVDYSSALIGSHAGTIGITTAEGIFIDGQMLAQAGDAQGTAGGKLSMSLNTAKRGDPDAPEGSSFPVDSTSGPRTFILSQEKNPSFWTQLKTAGAQSGDNLNGNKLNGKGYLAATQIAEGGFSSLSIDVSSQSIDDSQANAITNAQDEIRFQDDVTLTLGNSIALNAAKYGWQANTSARGNVSLNAKTVSMGFNDQVLETAKINPTDGGGQLTIKADLIDLVGTSVTQGFNSVKLLASDDIRLIGKRFSSDELKFDGQFKTFSKLNLTADQVYPTSLSAFTLDVLGDPSGTVTFNKGNDTTPVLSALGKLTIQAPNIVQDGTLKSPFGEILFEASNAIKFGSKSITSVSAEGQIIPLGITEGGQDWFLPLVNSVGNNIKPLLELPEKKITIEADRILRDEGSVIDISGGGDLLAYEFIPGSGGSKDVLDSKEVFAVLPGVSNYAPYDFSETPKSGLKTGDSIFIVGGSGLAEGEYALLPARYALLPGAFLVTPQSASGFVIPGSTRSRVDGAKIVSGFRTIAGTPIRDQGWSEFVIEQGSIAHTRSEYNVDLASSFFAERAINKGLAVPRLTQDAGAVVFNAQSQLDLPTVIADVVNGGRGGLVDIVADNLSVVADKSGVTGVVELLASDIDKFKVESLLLGATRSFDSKTGKITLDVGSKTVTISDNTGIKAPELILAAQEKIELKSGSRVQAEGKVVDSDTDNVLEVSGDGALLRVSAGKQATIKRNNTSATPLKGDLLINEGVVITAGTGSVLLDSTHQSTLKGTLDLAGGSLNLGAQAINIGEVSGVTDGLNLDSGLISELTLKELVLTSRSSVNLYGQVEKIDAQGNTVPVEFGNLAIDSAGLVGWQNAGKTALLNAKTIRLANNTEVTSNTGTGTGMLTINAEQLILDKGNYQVSGFNQVNFNLKDRLIGRDEGKLTALSNITISTPYVSAENGAASIIDATNHNLILNQASQAVAATSQGIGAQLKLIADSVVMNTALLFKTGNVSISALQGDVTLGSSSLIDVSGAVVSAGLSKPVSLSAGKITLISEKQNVLADANSRLLLNGINADMQAGLLTAKAAAGQVQLGGVIDAHGIGAANGGSIAIDIGSLTASGVNGLNSLFTDAVFTRGIDLRLRNGDITVDATQTVSAQSITMSADTGKIEVDGTLDAQGDIGGSVTLAAEDGLTLNSGARILAGAQGDNGMGGSVTLSSIDKNSDGAGIEIKNGARIDVAATGNGKEGEVHLRADRLDTDNDGVQDVNIKSILPGSITGDSDVTVEAVRIYNDEDGIITRSDQDGYHADNQTFMAGLDARNVDNSRFGSGFTTLPGVEVRSAGDLTLAEAWDLSTWRYGSENKPGLLTLRATQDILVANNLSDAFAVGQINLGEFGVATISDFLQTGKSWSYHLVSGADLAAADSRAVVANVGDVKLGDNVSVRTGTGDINIQAGRDIVYGNSHSVIYTAGRPDETNRWGFSPLMTGGLFYAEYPMDGGDISIEAGRDILAKPSEQLVTDWLVRTGNWSSNDVHDGERPTAWGIAYGTNDFTGLTFQHAQSLAALGGGNVNVRAGGDINDLSVVIPTTGKQIGQKTPSNDPTNFDYMTNIVEVKGGGNLNLSAGGDVAGGVFYVDGIKENGTGTANLNAAGSFKPGNNNDDTGQGLSPILALGDSRFTVTAGKDIALEAIIDPMIIPQNQSADASGFVNQFFRYSADSAVKLVALSGEIKLENDAKAVEKETVNLSGPNQGTAQGDIARFAANVMPATLKAYALHGDIKLGDEEEFRNMDLFPSAKGELELFAANNITGNGTINQSDADPGLLPSALLPATGAINMSEQLATHAISPVHYSDKNPVRISAATGDIAGISSLGLNFVLAKLADIEAGKNIENASFKIQHNHPNDAYTVIQAHGDIRFLTDINPITGERNSNVRQTIEVSGPGQLTVLADKNIELGASNGIKSLGNTVNTALADDGANVTVIAGLAGGRIDVNGFAEKFLANTDKYATEYQRYLDRLVVETEILTGKQGLTEETAKIELAGLSSSDKARIEKKLLASVQQVYFKELRLAGSKGAGAPNKQVQDQAELELLAAAEALFPGTTLLSGNNDYTVDPFKGVVAKDTTSASSILEKINAAASARPVSGGVSLPFSTIQTVDGGDTNLIVPNGGVVAGLPTSIKINGKGSGDLGIISKKQGNINVVVRDDFDVNTGRATTLGGGDVLGVSFEGDLAAGRTPKSQVSAPVTTVSYDNEGFPVIEVSPPQQGGGIAANSPPGTQDGNVDLFAFRGIIDAGEAGIAGKNVTVFGTAIVGADNIDVGGVSVGVPVASTGSIAAGLTGVSNLAASVTNAIDGATNVGEDTNKSIANAAMGILTIDFLGFGE